MRRAAAVARRWAHARRRRPRPPRVQQRPRCRRAAARRTSTPPRAVAAADRAVAEATVRTSANERKARPRAGLFFCSTNCRRLDGLCIFPTAKECPMKSLLLLTASGPLLILTSHESLRDQKLLEVLKQKSIGKFVAFEVPLSLAKQRYGGHFQAVESNLHETDDLRILDFNGQRVFQLFRFDELGSPILQEQL